MLWFFVTHYECQVWCCLTLIYVQIILSLVEVAWWSPCGKELLTRLTVCFFALCLFVILVTSNFVFDGRILVLITPVPDPEAIKLVSTEPRCEKTGLRFAGPITTKLDQNTGKKIFFFTSRRQLVHIRRQNLHIKHCLNIGTDAVIKNHKSITK